MIDREKVINGLKVCTQHGSMCGSDCNGHYERYTDDGYVIKLVNEYRSKCPYGKCETGCVKTLAKDALELLEEQEPIQMKVLEDYVSIKIGKCPKCKSFINNRTYPKSCGCGQKVKWDE